MNRIVDQQVFDEVGNFYAAGLNFRSHIEWANQRANPGAGGGYKVPTEADIGYRSPNALIAHGGNIVIPIDATGQIEYEGELVAVIGKKAKHLTEANALLRSRLHARQ